MMRLYRVFDEVKSGLMSFLRRFPRVSILTIGVLVFAIQCRAASYYVDYSSGVDTDSGTDTSSAWQHCPGDPAATGVAGGTPLNPGDTVFFKGGVQYVLTGDGNAAYQTGIGLNWSGSASDPITYDGNSAGAWGTGRAVLTDNYSTNHIAAFYTYGAVNNLAFNNLEIGPIGGAASLPPDPGTGVPSNQGYGIFINGSLSGVTIANCYFHDLGYWDNQPPMDGLSVASSDNRESSVGVETHAAVSLVITNCEFTRVHTGVELAYSGAMSNVTIAASRFHDYIVWCIDLAGQNGSLDDLYIHDNLFQDYDWAYSPTYWTGYNYHPESCSSCFTGPPHQDAIFHRTGTAGSINGANIDIYNNTWTGTHTNGVATSCIYLEYAASANIYNNLFNIPNAGIPGDGGGPEPAVEISYELNVASKVRILNNTTIVNTPANAQNSAFLWGACSCLSPSSTWPSNGKLAVENNVVYSFTGSGGGDPTLLTIGVVVNRPGATVWTIDYNDWFSLDTANDWFWWNNPTPSFNIHGDLGAMRTLGFETHGQTNDPLFASLAFGAGLNAAFNDYHLQSGSPAIGAGVNLTSLNLPGLNTDKDGAPRPVSGPWDLGAYEYNTNSISTPPAQGEPAPASVALAFSNVVQTCTTKTKIDHATMTTNSVTTCRVKFSLVASNTGATNSSAFQVLFWPGQNSGFDPTINPWSVKKRVKALAVGKTTAIKLTGKFNGNQAGTFVYVTDTNANVLASSVIPDPQ
jgi:hypothetical protein